MVEILLSSKCRILSFFNPPKSPRRITVKLLPCEKEGRDEWRGAKWVGWGRKGGVDEMRGGVGKEWGRGEWAGRRIVEQKTGDKVIGKG